MLITFVSAPCVSETKKPSRSLIAAGLLAAVSCGVLIPKAQSQDLQLGPPDVYMFAAALRQELDELAIEMGEEIVPRSVMTVDNVTSRYVFFEATSVFKKASALCFEFTQYGVPLPHPPVGSIESKDVIEVVTGALDRIDCVKQALNITRQPDLPVRDVTKTSTDVFEMLAAANRELNHLIEPEISHSDVYSKLVHVNEVVAQELEALAVVLDDHAFVLPELPPYEARKSVKDTYEQLVLSLDLLHDIGEVSGLNEVMTVIPKYDEQFVPGDLYDLVTILMAEVHYFAEDLHVQEADFEPDLTRHLPAHVFQQALLLERKLEVMLALVERHPQWHGKS